MRFLNWLAEFLARRSKKPWARFIVDGIDKDGQVKFTMSWNKAFIKNINSYGFQAESEEISVQNFLFGSMMYPKELEEEVEEISSDYHPHLQSEFNKLRK
jgi:hypothetical protein